MLPIKESQQNKHGNLQVDVVSLSPSQCNFPWEFSLSLVGNKVHKIHGATINPKICVVLNVDGLQLEISRYRREVLGMVLHTLILLTGPGEGRSTLQHSLCRNAILVLGVREQSLQHPHYDRCQFF